MFKSKHRMVWFALSPELRAITPAISRLLSVRSRCKRDVDSGRNSANAMAPADVREVDARKSRFKAVFNVNAVRND
jgi:hypothetical protein